MSGATVSLLEDGSEQTDKVVKISGTPDQAERAQSLLQGFILSSELSLSLSLYVLVLVGSILLLAVIMMLSHPFVSTR